MSPSCLVTHLIYNLAMKTSAMEFWRSTPTICKMFKFYFISTIYNQKHTVQWRNIHLKVEPVEVNMGNEQLCNDV